MLEKEPHRHNWLPIHFIVIEHSKEVTQRNLMQSRVMRSHEHKLTVTEWPLQPQLLVCNSKHSFCYDIHNLAKINLNRE